MPDFFLSLSLHDLIVEVIGYDKVVLVILLNDSVNIEHAVHWQGGLVSEMDGSMDVYYHIVVAAKVEITGKQAIIDALFDLKQSLSLFILVKET